MNGLLREHQKCEAGSEHHQDCTVAFLYLWTGTQQIQLFAPLRGSWPLVDECGCCWASWDRYNNKKSTEVEQLLSCEWTWMYHQWSPYIHTGLAGRQANKYPRQAKNKAKYSFGNQQCLGASLCSAAPKRESISVCCCLGNCYHSFL